MKKFIKENKNYILSFIIPLIILILVFSTRGFLTKEYSLLNSDLWHQYYELLIKLKDILNGGSLIYSFKIGFGQSFLSTFAYYIASPINLLVSFFNNIQSFITFAVILKISLCGLTMFSYLKYHFKKGNSILLVFSTIYALSLQILGNYFNIMWLDAYYLAPLVLLGIDKIVNENKSILYFVTLSLSIFSNYYMGYMICLFSVIYFIYKLVLKHSLKDKKEIKEKTIKFIVVSLLAGMVTMFINLPNLLTIVNIDRTTFKYPDLIGTFNMYISTNLSKMYLGNHEFFEFFNSKFVYWYCGIISVLLLPLYFLNKNINKKEKIASMIILLILVLSIFITPLNNVWHVFNAPLGFNYRYYYLFLIVIIYMCAKAFLNFDKLKNEYYIIINLVFAILGIIIYALGDMSYISLIGSITLMILYTIFINLYNNKDYINISKILLITVVFCELFINAYALFETKYFFDYEYLGYRNDFKKQIISKIEEIDDSKFYRIEFYNSLFNDSLLYDYNSLTAWYSTIDGGLVNSLGDLGYYVSLNQYKYNNLVPLNSLFSLKYYISDSYESEFEYVTTVSLRMYDENGEEFDYNNYIYKNPYYLSLGYMVDDNVLSNLISTNPYLKQNEILNQMTNLNEKYFVKSNLKEVDEYVYELEIENKNDFVIVINALQDLEFTYDLYLNNTYISTKNNEYYSINNFINNSAIGTKITISLKNIKGDFHLQDIQVYYKDLKSFEKIYNNLALNQLQLIEFKDGYVKGNIDATDDKSILFTSIPYEKGWKAIVDGKKVDTMSIYDMFLGIELEPGEHEIEFIYEQPGLKIGIFISIISVSLYGIYLYFEKKRNK